MLVPISNSFYNCYETIVLDDIKDIIIYEKESFFSYNLSKRIVPFLYNDLHEYVLKSSEYDGIKLKKSLIEKIKKNISVLNHPLNTNKIITITLRSYFYDPGSALVYLALIFPLYREGLPTIYLLFGFIVAALFREGFTIQIFR